MDPRINRKKTRKQRAVNFVIQGSIPAMAGIVIHTIGMLYRMPPDDIIGKQGNGYYMSALNMYDILPILSSYSIPVAVLKMISTRLARGEYRNCSRILKAALTYATAVGGIAVVVLWFGADLFAQLIETSFSWYVLETLAPTIWIIAYPGVPRGCFQGTGAMVPMAVSQILEQIASAMVSVVATGIPPGAGTSINTTQGAKDYSYVLGATGDTIGTRAEALMVFLFFIYPTASKGRERRQMVREDASERAESYRRVFYALTITVLPIVISSGTCNCPNVVDNYLFGQSMGKLGHIENSIATYWGTLGQYQPLLNIPVAVSNILSFSLILSLARTVANRNRREKLGRIATFIRLSLLVTIPIAVGTTVLAKPICNPLFINGDNTMLIRLSMAGSLVVIFYSLSTITDVVLQDLNHMDVPICHAVIALIIHVAMLEAFLMVFKMGIYSVMSANTMFTLVMYLLNGHVIAKFARYRQEYKRILTLPTIYIGFMGTVVYGVYRNTYALFPDQLMRDRMGMAIVVFPPVAVATLVYVVLFVRLKAMEEEELRGMPGGRRPVRLLNQFRLLG